MSATWQAANYVGYYTIDAKPACAGTNAQLLPREMQGQVSDRTYTFTLNVSWADALDMTNNAYIYRVCAHNDSGRACSDWASSSSGLPACQQTRSLKRTPTPILTLPKPGGEIDTTQVARLPLDRLIGAHPMEFKRRSGVSAQAGPIIAEPGGFAGPSPSMTGAFDTDFGAMMLTKTGGAYAYKDGNLRITKIYGDFMDGTWSQSQSGKMCADGAYRGTFHFRFTRGGFAGSYAYCDEPAKVGSWNGKRR